MFFPQSESINGSHGKLKKNQLHSSCNRQDLREMVNKLNVSFLLMCPAAPHTPSTSSAQDRQCSKGKGARESPVKARYYGFNVDHLGGDRG